MITYSKLGSPRRGRLGNQLFQIASTIGIARRHGHDWTLPMWDQSIHFKSSWSTGGRFEALEVPELGFHFDESNLQGSDHYSIDGWRQSERYWQGHEDEIRSQFAFADELENKVKSDLRHLFGEKEVIAISIRRGDFVDNPHYDQIPAMYYISALVENFPDLDKYNVLIFSDDAEYSRIHFECLSNAFFYSGSAIEQLCAMSLCDHFIISNSTFSWWGAYLGEKPGSRVIRPPRNFAGPSKHNSEVDFWPERWEKWEYLGRKLDLRDVTFTIPVFIDHNHRRSNLELCLCLLNRDLETNIIVGEQGSSIARKHSSDAKYHFFSGMREFHRTKMLNDMARMAMTRFVVNWDCDVAIVPLQLWRAVQLLRSGADMVYPYDGRFARVPRQPWFASVSKYLDLGIFRDTVFSGKNGKPLPTTSVGGAIMFNRAAFIAGGMENEKMVSFGPEDWERYFRFNILGYRIERTSGALYHFDHYCGPTSSSRNPHFKKNHKELDDIRALDRDQVAAYVETWPWTKL